MTVRLSLASGHSHEPPDNRHEAVKDCLRYGVLYRNLRKTHCLDGKRPLALHPAYQGRNIGRQLMMALESAAAHSAIERLYVPSSITAEGFYGSLGYRKVRDEFHGAERTIVMEKALVLTEVGK